MTPTGMDDWEQVRAAGKWHFVRRDGVLRWGVRTGVLVWVVLFFAGPVLLGDNAPNLAYLKSREFALTTAAAVVLWPAAGVAWGLLEWHRRERRHLR
jgi:hypothetical protein